jgi:hypothetical protein
MHFQAKLAVSKSHMEAPMTVQSLFRAGAAVVALAAAGLFVEVSSANAARRERDDGNVVTGCSRYGRGCVSGPTRRGQNEREVRLPGGTWYGCAGDCRDKLRAETVDFWDEHQRREGGSRRGR